MDQLPIKIAQILKQDGLTGNNNGLMHGKTGISIFFYHLARKTGNTEYEKIAEDLLDKVFASLNPLVPIDFENGLSGIGWGIEYLVQNNFAEGAIDEILEEVDNKVFKILNEEYLKSFELTTGLTGYLFYLINRLKNIKTQFSMTQRINRELLILTINKIDELVTVQFPGIVKDIDFDLFWRYPVMLYGLKEAFKLNIYNEKISRMVGQWLPNLEVYLPSLNINRLFLAVVLKQVCSQITNKQMERQIHNLLFATDFEALKAEVDHNVISIRSGWPGIACLLNIALKNLTSDWPNYQLVGQTYYEITERHKGQLKNLRQNKLDESSVQICQALDFTGIGLMELLWPGILSGCKNGTP